MAYELFDDKRIFLTDPIYMKLYHESLYGDVIESLDV